MLTVMYTKIRLSRQKAKKPMGRKLALCVCVCVCVCVVRVCDVELNVLGCLVDILGTNCDQCVSMVQCCFSSIETIRLIRWESPGRPPRLSHSS